MPDHRRFEQQIAQRLRDDLLAQLRTARRPMSTSELRTKAPHQPLRPGSHLSAAPLQEQVYRALCILRTHGKVTQHRSRGRTVTWTAVDDDDGDEIAELEAVFNASSAPSAQPNADPQRIAAHLKAAAHTAAHAVRQQPHTAVAVTEGLSAVVNQCAEVLAQAARSTNTGRTHR